MTVNRERVQLLVDALRSGNFEQGQNMLRTEDDKYCCLGVACEVARLNGIGIEWQPRQATCACSECQKDRWFFDGSNEALGDSVAEWYGLAGKDAVDPVIGHREDGREISMIRANDDLGWDFNKIADAVQKTYLEEDSK